MTAADRPVQRFSREYLEQTAATPPGEIARFLDDFRRLHASRPAAPPSRAISMRVPVPLLEAFKQRCKVDGVPYQTRIKQLMRDWLE